MAFTICDVLFLHLRLAFFIQAHDSWHWVPISTGTSKVRYGFYRLNDLLYKSDRTLEILMARRLRYLLFISTVFDI